MSRGKVMCEGGMCLQCTEIWGTAVDGQYYLCISRFKGILVQCLCYIMCTLIY